MKFFWRYFIVTFEIPWLRKWEIGGEEIVTKSEQGGEKDLRHWTIGGNEIIFTANFKPPFSQWNEHISECITIGLFMNEYIFIIDKDILQVVLH